MRILFGEISVSAERHRSCGARFWVRRSMVLVIKQLSALSYRLSAIGFQLSACGASGEPQLTADSLDRSVEAIAEVSQPRNDVLLGVELAVDDRRIDFDSRMMPLDDGDPFGGR